MSSEKTRENRVRRKSKVSDGRLIRVGLVGPKPRPKGVGDGHPVNIPEPLSRSEVGTQRGRSAHDWLCGWKCVGVEEDREARLLS